MECRLYLNVSTDKDLGECLWSEEYSGGKLSPVEVICIGLLIEERGLTVGVGEQGQDWIGLAGRLKG